MWQDRCAGVRRSRCPCLHVLAVWGSPGAHGARCDAPLFATSLPPRPTVLTGAQAWWMYEVPVCWTRLDLWYTLGSVIYSQGKSRPASCAGRTQESATQGKGEMGMEDVFATVAFAYALRANRDIVCM
jgi:hypothetical protein